MTQLPPEDVRTGRAPREHAGLEWDALLSGDAPRPAATGSTPAVSVTAPTAVDPAGHDAPSAAAYEPVRGNDPFESHDDRPLTRRERRALEEQREAESAGEAASEVEVRPNRAERRAASSFDDHHDAPPKRRGRGAVGCLVGLLVVAALVVGAFFFLQGPINAVLERFAPTPDYTGSGTGEVTFMIADGDTGSDIATNLHEQGVTASYDAFYDLLLKQRPEPEFHPGAYKLAEQMSAKSALDALLDPANKLENTFVIPEGTATADALTSIAEGTGIPLEQLQAAAAESPQSYGLPAEATSLEGFLFPATYTLDPGLDARGALQALVDRQFQALDEAGVAPADRWKTIVLASLIQREAGLRDDYYKVSRVFQNRLDPAQWESGLLQSDATVAYGTGNTHRVATTDAERADASNPYNTYVHPGLPIGPISNPGDLAIDAALHPADGSWLYFVTWNLDTGETIFSTTQEEHDAAVDQWLAWMDEHPEYQ